MRKLLIALLFAGVSAASYAQEEGATERYSVSTNSFWNNWFVQGGVEWNAWYSNYEDGMGLSKSPFKRFRSNPSVSVAIGKWFSPGLGLRTKVQGIWGKAVWDDNNEGNGNKYWILNEQVLFNLSNMLCGYNPDRVWDFIPFIGGGFGRSCTYSRYAMGLSFGLLNEFKVSRKLALNLELGWNRHETDIVGMQASKGSGSFWNHSNNFYAEVGVTFNIGKSTWERVPDVDAINALSQSQIDALNAQLEDERAENERLRGELDKKEAPAAKPEKEFFAAPVSVFFNFDKSEIASRKELVNVKELAEYAKANGATLVVTGYADSSTGNADYNRNLSLKRAEKVAAEIEKMGVDKENIKIHAKGGVDTLVPPSYNRRVIVEIEK